MIINNFELIKNLIQRKSDDINDFWFLQIIKRRKDNPNLPRDMKLIDNYFIKGTTDLEEKQQRIIDQCEENNARAYFRLNKRNYKKVSCETLRIIAEGIAGGDYSVVKHAFLSVCGQFHSDENKTWLIDLDLNHMNTPYKEEESAKVVSFIRNLHDDQFCRNMNYKIIAVIPTVSGFHILTNPFDRLKYSKSEYNKYDIHKDNPTLLYF